MINSNKEILIRLAKLECKIENMEQAIIDLEDSIDTLYSFATCFSRDLIRIKESLGLIRSESEEE